LAPTAVIVVFAALASMPSTSARFPYPYDEPFMIQAYRRDLVWEPRNGELNTGNEIVLSPIDPTRLTQFWITRPNGYIYNAAAPDYVLPDWHGIEGHNATLILNNKRDFNQLWFTYSGDDEPNFQINAMSPLHYCVRGHDTGLPLILTYCTPQDFYPYQRWVYNKEYALPSIGL